LRRVGLSMVLREQDPCADFGFKGLIYITIRCVYIKSNVSLKLPPNDVVCLFPSRSFLFSLPHAQTCTRVIIYIILVSVWRGDYSLGTWVFVEIAPLGCVVAFRSASIYAFMYLFIYSRVSVCTFASISYTRYGCMNISHIYLRAIGSNRM